MAILLKKMTIFDNFFEKKCQVFGNFLTVNWHFSGGSAWKARTINIIEQITKDDVYVLSDISLKKLYN